MRWMQNVDEDVSDGDRWESPLTRLFCREEVESESLAVPHGMTLQVRLTNLDTLLAQPTLSMLFTDPASPRPVPRTGR